MSRQFEPGRAIEIISPQYGSGYRIGGRLVLTAAHLLPISVGSSCQVRAKPNFGAVEATVVWKAEGWDIALIELPESVAACTPAALGQLPEGKTGEKLEFQMYGYPLWGRTQRDAGKTAAGGRQIEGVIYLADRSPDGLLVLEAQRLPPEATTERSQWEGASGAAIVCDGLVIGVQSWHQNPQRPASLEAAPLLQVSDNPQWCDWLRRHGIDPELAIAAFPQKQGGGDTFNFENAGATIGTQIGKADKVEINLSPAPVKSIAVPYYYPRDLGSTTFVGRVVELEQLHQLLQQAQRVGIVAATGMGGIGKTELAWQYADLHRADYQGGIWWLSASRLVGEVLTYGVRMQLPAAPDTLESDPDRVQWYYDRWLEALPDGERLLVWDDVSDYDQVRSFLPQDERYRVLLTTRLQLSPPVQRFALGVLKPAEALELLQRLVGEGDRLERDRATAQALCQWLGYLPLGLELVGRYLANLPTLKLITLLERLEKQRLKAIALQQVPSEMPYRDNLEAAFELSWQLLDTGAKQFGCLLSVFGLAPVRREWVVASLPGWDEETIEAAEVALLRGSLVSLEEGQYLLHTLLREFFTQKLETEMTTEAAGLQRGMAAAMVAEAKTVEPTVTLTELGRVQGAIPHWQVVAANLTGLLVGSDGLWCFNALARVAAGQNRWQEAEEWYKACLERSEARFGGEHPDTASSLNNLAELYRAIGRYGEALPLYERALAIREQELGASHPATASSLNNLAGLYRAMGRYGEAEGMYVRAISIWQEALGADHPHTQTGIKNFRYLLQKVIESGRVRELSDHPMTQALLRELSV